MLGVTISISQDSNALFLSNELVVTAELSDGKDIEVDINAYPFTQAGKELATLVSKSISVEAFVELAREIVNENKKYTLGVYKIVSLDEKSITYDDKNLLEPISNNED